VGTFYLVSNTNILVYSRENSFASSQIYYWLF
jgi:hypothetical protein